MPARSSRLGVLLASSLLASCLGCVSPIVVDEQGVGLGLFEVRDEHPEESPALDIQSVRGLGAHVGPNRLAIGWMRWETITARPTPAGVAVRRDWIDLVTGRLAESTAHRSLNLPR